MSAFFAVSAAFAIALASDTPSGNSRDFRFFVSLISLDFPDFNLEPSKFLLFETLESNNEDSIFLESDPLDFELLESEFSAVFCNLVQPSKVNKVYSLKPAPQVLFSLYGTSYSSFVSSATGLLTYRQHVSSP